MNEPALILDSSVPRRLDTLLAEGCTRDAFLREVSALCSVSAESPWETLALIDQYYRRGKLSNELFVAAKRRIETRVLGVQDAVVFIDRASESEPRPTPATKPAPSTAAVLPTAPATPAEDRTRAEMGSLRAELAHARQLAAVYRERLEDLEWRRAAAQSADAVPAAPTARPAAASAARPPGNPWLGVAAVGVLVLTATALFTRPGARPQVHPERQGSATVPEPVHQAALPTVPKPRLPGQLHWLEDRSIVYPGDRTALLTVRRDGGTGGQVGFAWWTAGLGARAGQDYTANGRQNVIMGDGQEAVQLHVPILRNPHRRHTEMFAVYLGKPLGGASIGALDQATVFLLPEK